MRGLRRILVPISWAVLLAWMLGPLLPEAGLRVHAHADGDAAHVHLDELIAEAIGHRRHHHPAGEGHAHFGARRHDPRDHDAALSVQADDAASPGGAVLPRGGPRAATDVSGRRRDGATRESGAALRLPAGLHAHASSPFLLFVLAVLAVLLLATRAAALPPPPRVALREARRGRPRARAPPLFLPGRRFQTT